MLHRSWNDNDLVYSGSSSESELDHEEDSNEEDNWRNDYPDEDEFEHSTSCGTFINLSHMKEMKATPIQTIHIRIFYTISTINFSKIAFCLLSVFSSLMVITPFISIS